MLSIGEADTEALIRSRLTWRDWRPTWFAACLSLVLVIALVALFDGVSTNARPAVLGGLSNTVFWLAASVIGSCGTVAALMLTALGLLEHLETRRMTGRFLFHLRLVVTAALTTIALAVLALLLTVFPAAGTEEFSPEGWQIDAIYWSLLVVTALMIGGFTIVLGSLRATIGEVFRTLPQEWIEEILADNPEEDDRQRGSRGRRP